MSAGNLQARLVRILEAPPEVQRRIDAILDQGIIQDTGVPRGPLGPLLVGTGAGARFLGVSRTTIWRMIRAGVLERVEVLPGCYRLRRSDLEAIAAANPRETQPDHPRPRVDRHPGPAGASRRARRRVVRKGPQADGGRRDA